MTCGVLEFGDESGGAGDSTVVAAELDGEEDDAAADGIDGIGSWVGFSAFFSVNLRAKASVQPLLEKNLSTFKMITITLLLLDYLFAYKRRERQREITIEFIFI